MAERYQASGIIEMAVYVDNYNAPFGGMVMCHMIADSADELLAMADRIGVQRKWIQYAGTPKEHFDVCLSKKAKAVNYGAIQISPVELVRRMMRKRILPGVCPVKTRFNPFRRAQ